LRNVTRSFEEHLDKCEAAGAPSATSR
jgi:hypothetical protein